MSEVKGGMCAHWMRRLTHVSMCVIPFAYHAWADQLTTWLSLTHWEFIGVLLCIVLLFEAIRLAKGVIAFGQRDYERRQPSALAWGAVALIAVCGLASHISIAVPIVWTCAFVDPVMGEMRRLGRAKLAVFLIGLLLAYFIWLASVWLLATPLLFALVCPLVSVLSELPRLRWVDDNALMMLSPLAIVILMMHV